MLHIFILLCELVFNVTIKTLQTTTRQTTSYAFQCLMPPVVCPMASVHYSPMVECVDGQGSGCILLHLFEHYDPSTTDYTIKICLLKCHIWFGHTHIIPHNTGVCVCPTCFIDLCNLKTALCKIIFAHNSVYAKIPLLKVF